MESLVNYGSDDECGDFNELAKSDSQSRDKIEEDANYDEVGMDESSEESNNNHTEGHFSAAGREKQDSNSSSVSKLNNSKGAKDKSACYMPDGSLSESDNSRFEEEESSYKVGYKDGGEEYEDDDDEDDMKEEDRRKENVPKRREDANNVGCNKNAESCGSEKNEEAVRRHSSDMEMDDGEDDLNNYKSEGSKYNETTASFRQQFMSKGINFTKGKGLGAAEPSKKFEENCQNSNVHSNSTNDKAQHHPWDSKGVAESERNSNADEMQRPREEKSKKERGREVEDRRKEEHRRRDDRDGRKRDDERWRESERDRRRENEKHRDDRRRSPDRRKRSHSPDRRDRDRDRERDRDRDRDREYRSSDRRSPKHSRRGSRSPDRSWKVRKLEKKAAVLNKLGIELKADVMGNLTPRQLLGEQLKAQIQEVEAKTGVTLPTYYNPGVMNPLKYAQQIQKRKLLWGNKSAEAKTSESASGQGPSVPSTVKQWEAATFKGDSDGKMTEKFKRLMGIKGDTSAGNVGSSKSKPPETKEIIQKQEEMFSNMEAQYQVARMATHTHRGVGLGFGTFQVPPR